jgi:hypothetical protein
LQLPAPGQEQSKLHPPQSTSALQDAKTVGAYSIEAETAILNSPRKEIIQLARLVFFIEAPFLFIVSGRAGKTKLMGLNFE